MAKRKGDTFSPCLTSISQLKKSENVCPDFTQDLIYHKKKK
jgi:hypothetical protein